MNTTIIRRATLKDLPQLEKIEMHCFAPDRRSSKRAICHSLKSSMQRVYVSDINVENESRTIGMMTLFMYAKTIRIYSLAVLAEHRKEGVGRLLLQHVIKCAKKSSKLRITLEADKQNRQLIQWYEKAGFRVVEKLPGYYGKAKSAVRMELRIDSQSNMLKGHVK